jgi:hypothetical protein
VTYAVTTATEPSSLAGVPIEMTGSLADHVGIGSKNNCFAGYFKNGIRVGTLRPVRRIIRTIDPLTYSGIDVPRLRYSPVDAQPVRVVLTREAVLLTAL